MENQDNQQIGPRLNISKSQRIKFFGLSLLIFALILGTILILTRNKSQEENQKTSVVNNTSAPTEEKQTFIGWGTYEASNISFDYPKDYKVEEREKGLFVIFKDENKALGEAGITIDARRIANINSNFNEAISSARNSLTEQAEKEITNGIKMYGIIKDGSAKGTPLLSAHLRYGQGALVVESTGEILNEAIFDQIVSSVKIN